MDWSARPFVNLCLSWQLEHAHANDLALVAAGDKPQVRERLEAAWADHRARPDRDRGRVAALALAADGAVHGA